MKETLKVINQMQADGVIGRYAIGGAVGAIFWLEAMDTEDLDVFVSLEPPPGGLLITLEPIYDYLVKGRGCERQDEYIVIGDWPVQFLPPGGSLGEEAIAKAIDAEVEEVPTRVMTAEHLVALALETGRGKDWSRILKFIDDGKVDLEKVRTLAARHGLLAKWGDFEKRFLPSES